MVFNSPGNRTWATLCKRGLLLVFLTFVTVHYSGCYLLKQGLYVIKYSASAEPIDRIVQSDTTDQELREFLTRVLEIREFAIMELGLAQTDNFTRYINIDKPYLIDVIYAARKTSFEQYKWCFPFFGCFPYKGYFEKSDALHESERLERKGWETFTGKVDAFSTLGFFPDPVYSFMKNLSPYQLAYLICHELTHSTIFLKNRINFNEEMATFIGFEAALMFIEKSYGQGSPILTQARMRNQDRTTFVSHMKALYDSLQVVYTSTLSDQDKLSQKKRIIDEYKERIHSNYKNNFKTESYKRIPSIPINNAFIAVEMTYTRELDLFYDLYNVQGRDLKKTIQELKMLKGYRGDPKEYIRKKYLSNHAAK